MERSGNGSRSTDPREISLKRDSTQNSTCVNKTEIVEILYQVDYGVVFLFHCAQPKRYFQRVKTFAFCPETLNNTAILNL